MLSRAGSAASAGRSTLWWRHGLVAAQAAMATALLISASLLLASFWRLGRVPLGYDGDQVVTVELQLLDFRYAVSRAVAGRFQDDLMGRVRAIPGISDVAVTSAVPFRGFDPPVDLPVPGVGMLKSVPLRTVDPGYFRVMRIPAVRGRLLDENDRAEGPPVAVISESLARMAFGSADPIGRKIGATPVTEVVGVVADPYYANLEKDPSPTFYIPRSQNPRVIFSLVARTTATTSVRSVIPAIRRVIRDLDPELPAMNFTTVGELVDASVANRRFYTVATVAFAAIALLLTTAGLVVVVARVVAERRRELAIRAALGATRAVLMRTATRDALIAVSLGVAIGLAGAFSASGVLRQFLFAVAPRSPVAYSVVAVLVLSVAVLAAWAPVRRFDRTSLLTLLKAE
jgi:predicted permease